MGDISTIFQYIANYGFPCVMAVVLLYAWRQSEKTNKETIDSLRKTLEGNPQVLSRIEAKLNIEHKIKETE